MGIVAIEGALNVAAHELIETRSMDHLLWNREPLDSVFAVGTVFVLYYEGTTVSERYYAELLHIKDLLS